MALRVFRCKDCDHKMRYGAPYCGSCGYPTPEKNRVAFLLVPLTTLVILIVGVGMLV